MSLLCEKHGVFLYLYKMPSPLSKGGKYVALRNTIYEDSTEFSYYLNHPKTVGINEPKIYGVAKAKRTDVISVIPHFSSLAPT